MFQFRTATRCEALNQEGCVGVATNVPGVVGVQDTITAAYLTVSPAAWQAFTGGVKAGAYELPDPVDHR